MIDYRSIENELVRIARESIGKYLSTTESPKNIPLPSILIERPIRSKPNYPYLTLDLLETRAADLMVHGIKLNPDESVSYTKSYTMLYQFTVYGTNSELRLKAHAIAQELETQFMLPSVRDGLQCNACVSLDETQPVENVPQRINAEEWLEVALFALVLTTYDDVSENSGVFDKIQINGELHRNREDPNPLPVEINLP